MFTGKNNTQLEHKELRFECLLATEDYSNHQHIRNKTFSSYVERK